MGRLQYLSRLALGRSAFADGDEADGPEDAVNHAQVFPDADETQPPSSDQPYVQRYDAKGRPVNPSAEERKAALRNAENAALALVGVVKRNDNHARLTQLKFGAISAVRANVLANENDVGEECDLLVTLVSGLNYATETLVRRVQAGLYSPTSSFVSVLQSGLEAIRHAGSRGALAVLFPGSPTAMVHATVRVLIAAAISHSFEALSLWLIRQKLRKRTTRRVHRALYFTCEAVLIGLDVALLPLEYFAYAQRLGLAPTSPWLPSWRILLPSHPGCVHNFGWTSNVSIPVLRTLCSPAALMIVSNTVWREQDAEIPAAGQITNFQYPEQFNESTSYTPAPSASSDSIGWLLHQAYILRTKLMRSLGYDLEHRARLTKFEDDIRPPSSQPANRDLFADDMSSSDDNDNEQGKGGMHHIHRSTALAHLAPEFLAARLDVAFAKLLFLPLQALTVRAVAQAYMASPLPKSSFALTALPHLYRPFSSELLRSGSWSALTSYLSKLGLSLGLHATTSASIFFMLYGLSRWQGRRSFDWGVAGAIGGLTYPAEGEE